MVPPITNSPCLTLFNLLIIYTSYIPYINTFGVSAIFIAEIGILQFSKSLYLSFAKETMSSVSTNAKAQNFKALHVPGQPLILVNVHDAVSARIVASLPECKALATASFSVALSNNTSDANLDLETQIVAVKAIAAVAQEANKPLTVDLQDGYGDRLEEAVKKLIEIGVVGINLEDCDQKTDVMFSETIAIQRIKRVLAVAAEAGVPDFVVNARSDTFLRGGTLDEAIRRGKLYLEAGATTIYVLGGGPGGLTSELVKKTVDGLGGRVNFGLRLPKGEDAKPLTSTQLAELGVARISIGPQLYFACVEAIKKTANTVFAK
jgi:2-methylisocitrate lyase-like PEP mutase family enzyme